MFKRIPIRHAMREVPLLRSVMNHVEISPDLIWKYHGLQKTLVPLGKRAGYPDKLNPYNFRRAHGNSIDSKRTASPK